MQEKKGRGSLFIVSAPSGAGKTTLCKKLDSVLSNLRHSISYTTRPPRPGEVSDRDYTFVDKDTFRLMIERGEFAEWARVHGQLYGTSKKRLGELLDAGIDVILDIDTQGAMQIKEKYKEGIYIFILPPSMKALRERLEKRMANSKDELELRLRKAVDEIKDYYKYDYVIVNDIFKEALKELEAIIISDRVSTKRINISWIEDSFLK